MNPETEDKWHERAKTVKDKSVSGAKKIKDKTVETWKSGWKGKVFCLGVVVLLAVCLCTCFRSGYTIDEFREKHMREFNKEFANPSSEARKSLAQYVESAHLTVTVTSVQLIRLDVETLDGKDHIGKDDENLKSVSMLIRCKWEGFVDKGYTDLRINYDAATERHAIDIEYTTAMVNLEDEAFWEGFGAICGFLLAL